MMPSEIPLSFSVTSRGILFIYGVLIGPDGIFYIGYCNVRICSQHLEVEIHNLD